MNSPAAAGRPDINTQTDIRASMGARRPADVGKIEKARNPNDALIRLLPYLLPFKATIVLVVFCVVVYTALALAGPYLMGLAIDQYIVPGNLSGLAGLSAAMLGLYLLNNVYGSRSPR